MDYAAYKKAPNSLREFRKKLGWTQLQVAQYLGFKDKTWICHWERGDALPNIISTIKLAKLYNASLAELFPAVWERL